MALSCEAKEQNKDLTTPLGKATEALREAEKTIKEHGVLVGIEIWSSAKWHTLLEELVNEIALDKAAMHS